jgi:DNA-binding CsgD family transcriptional regulator/tetratricopeptide (TPR) repeat protein
MGTRLLEREAELDALDAALVEAAAGSGSVVLLCGEAGIGKTNLVRAFQKAASGRARMLAGACDDLLTPRPLGPLLDLARAAPGGPLAVALAGGDRDAVLSAVHEELSHPQAPTVLVVEDAHWADEATLDVLRYIGRRVAELPALLLITYRDDEIGPGHPLQRVLGGFSGGSARRIRLRQLSRAAVARLVGGTNATSAALYRLTAGNPFFVSEVLASLDHEVPATVVDAVLARVRRLEEPTQRALEQLAVVPSRVELSLARTLLGDLTVLAEAERLGVLEVRPDAVAFRHELARRAVEGSLPVTVGMRLNERVLSALLAQDDPDLARVVHHAVQAGDDAAVVAHAPEAARRACRAGAQGQGAALYGHALRRRKLLGPPDEAALSEAYAWALYNSERPDEAVRVAEDAVRLREELGDDAALGQAVANLAIWQWSSMQPAAAYASVQRAMPLLERDGDSAPHMSALIYLGVVLVHLDREELGLAPLQEALAMAERIGSGGLVPLGLMYRGRARLQLGDRAGLTELLRGIELAREVGDHGSVMIGYVTVVAMLWRLGRHEEMVRYLDEGAEYGRDHDYPTHDRGREVYRYRLLALRGEWDAAEQGLRDVLGDADDPGLLGRYALPTLARLAVRRGRDDAADALAAARANAERGASLPALLATTAAELEHAWLTDHPEPVRTVAMELLPRCEQPGRDHERGELLRYLRRLGEPVEPFAGCPPQFAAGLRGDWRAAAAAWELIGDPYERALELADSGEVEPTLEALAVLDGLEARPAAARTRRRLRDMGVTAVPRGPQTATRNNPAQLTTRQVQILGLLAEGRTNAEIAARLVVSVRTVDHHVSAVLQKLGVATRKEAAAAAAEITAM